MRVILLAFFSFAIVTAFQQNINMPSGTNTATHTTCTANFMIQEEVPVTME